MHDYELALLGCDVPGSKVLLTVAKPDGKEVDVILSRMARSEMADRVKMFELFTSLEEFVTSSGDGEHARILDETIQLYTQMQEDAALRDTTIVHNVLDMQNHSSSMVHSLKEKVRGLHASVENHVAGYGDQIMELQV